VCGVVGLIDFSGLEVQHSVLKKMTDAIAHRGPDGEGYFLEENIALGHRRLAIIDLSEAGQQPMVSRDGTLAISYNGELYNYREIRKQLENLGHQFISATDTEVLLNAWLEWGDASVEKFNGMFAFAIWNSRDQTIHLVRDRYGIKPLYYAEWGKMFLFGSEQKAILAHPEARRNLDKKAVYEYFTFQNILTDRTFIEQLRILPAATILRVDVKNRAKKTFRKYWDFKFTEVHKFSDQQEYEEEFDRLLKQAVSRQLMSDVPLGSYLSGGMDSGTISSLASKNVVNLNTFTVGFDLNSASGLELAFDERSKAKSMASLLGTKHHEIILKSGDMEKSLASVTQAIEEPRVGQSYPNYYAAQLASKHVKVVLSGVGGDELFAGYPWRYFRSATSRSFGEYVDQYYSYWQRLLPNKVLPQVFSPIWSDVKDVWTKDIFRDVFANHENRLETPTDFINHSLYFEAKTFLHGLLVVEDKLSMAHSLETRVPFLDNDLVDFAMQCPLEMKLRNLNNVKRINENESGGKKEKYFEMEKDGKMILRRVMSNYIPKSITEGAKQGFSAPDASWFKGESINYVKNVLTPKNANIYEYLDYSAIQVMLKEHFDGVQNRRLLIWSLLTFEKNLEWMTA
jgi:asparagine synthase (glutamine-hydrolysing)